MNKDSRVSLKEISIMPTQSHSNEKMCYELRHVSVFTTCKKRFSFDHLIKSTFLMLDINVN